MAERLRQNNINNIARSVLIGCKFLNAISIIVLIVSVINIAINLSLNILNKFNF